MRLYSGSVVNRWAVSPVVRTVSRCVERDGYFRYRGVNDNLIKSPGYRIGPAGGRGRAGAPPAVRGSEVIAWMRVMPDIHPGDALIGELQDHVKCNLVRTGARGQ